MTVLIIDQQAALRNAAVTQQLAFIHATEWGVARGGHHDDLTIFFHNTNLHA